MSKTYEELDYLFEMKTKTREFKKEVPRLSPNMKEG
jgi:hypothetical protein